MTFQSPELQNIYFSRAIFQKDRNAYYSGLYAYLKKFIYNEKAVYAKECEFSMEKIGYPPVDVSYALKHLTGITCEPRKRYGREYKFYFYSSMKKSKKWDKIRKRTIQKKVQLITDFQRRYLDKGRKGTTQEKMVYDTLLYGCKSLTPVDRTTYKFAGKEDYSHKKEIDIIVRGNTTNRFYGLEIKAHDSLVSEQYFKRKLDSHFAKCAYYSQNPRKITLHPVFLVRLCSDGVQALILKNGGFVVSTEKIWFNDMGKTLNERYKKDLHHYFYTYIKPGKIPKVLPKKLDSLEN